MAHRLVARFPSVVVVFALAACGTSVPERRSPEKPTAAAIPLPPPPAPPHPEILVARARALRAEGDVAGARVRLEAALEAAPSSDEVRIELADLLIADGADLSRAGELLAGVGARDARGLHLALAQLAEARGDDAAAASEYEVVLGGGDDADARLRHALVLERLGRREESTAELERVRAARPDDAIARSRLAEQLEAAGRLDEAEGEYRWLAEAKPDRAAGWERLARFYERAGRSREARAAAERARAAGGRSPGRTLRPLLPSKR